jgi:copper homeostasis protein
MTGPLLEVIVTSVQDAIEAERGGATRLEAVRELGRGGLTPSLELVRDIMQAVRIPVRVMVRENDGFGVLGVAEGARLRRAAGALGALGVDGLVLGFVREGSPDVETTLDILSAAPGLRATFHHAFDELDDPFGALAALKGCDGVDCVLTHPAGGDWTVRAARLSMLATAANPEIMVMVGGGVDAAVMMELRRRVPVAAFHVGRAARVPPAPDGHVSATNVRALAAFLGAQPREDRLERGHGNQHTGT